MPGYRQVDVECNCRPHSEAEMEQCLFYVQCTITLFDQDVFFVPIHQALSYGLKLGEFKAFVAVYHKLIFVLLTYFVSTRLQIMHMFDSSVKASKMLSLPCGAASILLETIRL
jgi:hypothetical protein